MSIRVDKRTGKHYTWHNIPLGKNGHLTAIDSEKGYFVIRAMNHSHPEESWYNGEFIGDKYAVFKLVKKCFLQQVTPWYSRFGWAVRMLFKIAKGE